MSAKELKFKAQDDCILKFKFEDEALKFYDSYHGEEPWEFDRAEAHLLMLFLQDHLNSPISTELDKAITDEIKNKPKDIMG